MTSPSFYQDAEQSLGQKFPSNYLIMEAQEKKVKYKLHVTIFCYGFLQNTEDLIELAGVKVQEKIKTNKQLNRFDIVLNEMTGVVSEIKDETRSDDDNDEDQPVAKFYELGFLHSKVIKKVFCCLTENQHIGKNNYQLVCLFFECSSQVFSS